jgi:hydrogenase maturation factor
MSLPEYAACAHDETCITCGDTAVVLVVERVDHERELALCANDEGAKETVETALVGSVRPGDHLLVHAGTALQRADDGAAP